jgi:putative membrane protein
MTSLSRTIEVNLRQHLGETKLPADIQPVNGFVY